MNFGLQPLLGKAVAMIQDARLSGRTDAAVVAERLLSHQWRRQRRPSTGKFFTARDREVIRAVAPVHE